MASSIGAKGSAPEFSRVAPGLAHSPKGKAAKPTEFGKMIKIQEAESQIIIDYEVYDERPNDCDLLLPALSIHEQMLGRTPRLVTADAAFFSTENETVAHARGDKRIAIPN